MTNALALINDDDLNAITIMGPDGQPLTIMPLGEDESTVSMVGSNKMPRLTCTQDSEDTRLFGHPGGTLFLTKSEYAIDEEDGSGTTAQATKLIGSNIITGYLLGSREVRSYYSKKYNAAEKNPPACGSYNAKIPDPRYVAAGTAPSPMCVGRNPKTGKIVEVCPKAGWSTNDEGERIAPKCAYTVKSGFAALIDGEWMVFNTFMKRKAETSGRQIFRGAELLKARGLPLFTYPVSLKSAKVEGKKGYYIIGMMAMEAAKLDDQTRDTLDNLTAQWKVAQEEDIAYAKTVEEKQPDPFGHIPDRTKAEDPDLLV